MLNKIDNMLYVVFSAVILSGCASYHPVPLPSEIGSKATPPDYAEIRIQARQIHHPILKPIEFDERDGLSPDEAAVLAVLVNPELKAARDKKQIAAAQLLQAGLLPNPRLSYDMEFPTGGETEGTVTAFAVGADWDISSLISHQARVDAARSDVNSVSLDVAWQEWQVAEGAKLHAYRLMFADKTLAVAEDALAGQKEYRNLIEKGFNLGEKTTVELTEADSAVRHAALAVLTARQRRQKERLALNQAMGLSPGEAVTLQKDIALPYFENLPSQKELIEPIRRRRLDLLALRAGYQSQEAKVRAAIKSQFPKISIGPSVGRDIEDVDTAGFGLSVDLPFFDRNQGNIAMERATRRQLFDEYSARLSDAGFEIANALEDIESTRRQLDAAKQYLPVLEKSAHSYKKAAENGSGDYLSYYKVLNAFYSAEIELLGLQKRLVETGIALEIASGRYLPARQSSDVEAKSAGEHFGEAKK
jgi:outer membrane protein TolC